MEACVKADGTTVDAGLATFEAFLDLADTRVKPYQLRHGSHWRCYDFAPSSEYIGALAASGDTVVRFTWWAGPGDEQLGGPELAPTYESGRPQATGGGLR